MRTCRSLSFITGLQKREHKYVILNTFGVGRVFVFTSHFKDITCVREAHTDSHTVDHMHTHTHTLLTFPT